TSPAWLIREGGWEAESTVEYFCRYAAYVADQLGGELNYICTINEANMGLQLAAISKRYMLMAEQARKAAASGAKQAEGKVQVGMNFEKMMENMKFAAMENAQAFGTPQPQTFVSARTPAGDILVMRAHQAARKAIKARCPHIQVGLTLSLHDLQSQPGGEAFAEAAWEEEFRHYLPYIEGDDFLGVQNYTRTVYGPAGQLPAPQGAELTQMEYEFYPQALAHVLRQVHRDFPGDLIVTENGIATADDTRRVAFLQEALAGVQACLTDGLPIRGYFHWSLLDNFEWQKGFSMTFGLIAVDRATQKRTPKPSLAFLGSFAG
ncbi:MAG: family 1 glycosylhydrolase, partial [Clostridia bacterium]|nr:family 1 glycosylhydrolase [Clostridia bacterium]